MASFRHLSPFIALLLLGLPGLPATAQGAAARNILPSPSKDQRKLPISLDAASSEVDYKTNTVVFKDIVISQGDTKVQADHARATGLDFDNSRWTFEGNVRINGEQHGSLHSDQATVDFRNNRIARATIDGSPAEFEQKRADSDQVARGHAKEIVYDVNDATVRLSDDAWLSDGRTETSAPLLVYDIRKQQLQAASKPETDQRVHIKIDPRSKDEIHPKP
ncbi:MAG TPA: lipopolysaccharide transport periplasmic protein LptA [Steroidobacteraceae bacterium]|nr:lipopolysaccharide transport periplasmic protein LptA [Steroidobacteraceae bacterium]